MQCPREPQVFSSDFQRSGEEQEVINNFTASQRELASFVQFTSQVPKHSLVC